MYELLIRIETLSLGTGTLTLLGVGSAAAIIGLLLWLAGAYFSTAIIGILGAVVGSFCGLLVAQWLEVNALLSMCIGAAALSITSLWFKNTIIIILAIIVFALVAGTTYSSLILGDTVQPSPTQPDTYMASSFSRMDLTARQSYVDEITKSQEGFFEKLKVLLKDTFNSLDPYKWKLLLAALSGVLVALVLVWLVKRVVMAVCCSAVGAMLTLAGVDILLLLAGFQLCSALQQHRQSLSVTYYSMVAVGTIIQLIFAKSRRKGKEKPEKPDEAEKS
jgi:hypothetical protein